MQSDNVARAAIKYLMLGCVTTYLASKLKEKSDCIVRNISSSVSYCDERLYMLRIATAVP